MIDRLLAPMILQSYLVDDIDCGSFMKSNRQIKWSDFGVVVTLVLGLMVFSNIAETSLFFLIMILSTGMLHVCNIAQRSDPTFLNRNRMLMYLIVSGIAIPPVIYLGRRLILAEESGIPFSLRILLALLFGTTVIVSAIVGMRRR